MTICTQKAKILANVLVLLIHYAGKIVKAWNVAVSWTLLSADVKRMPRRDGGAKSDVKGNLCMQTITLIELCRLCNRTKCHDFPGDFRHNSYSKPVLSSHQGGGSWKFLLEIFRQYGERSSLMFFFWEL